MAAADPQSKKWQLTINNPQDCGLDREHLLDILSRFSLEYCALSDEIASTGTPHTHVFCTRTPTCGSPRSTTGFLPHT